jgi:hypothetical protein
LAHNLYGENENWVIFGYGWSNADAPETIIQKRKNARYLSNPSEPGQRSHDYIPYERLPAYLSYPNHYLPR